MVLFLILHTYLPISMWKLSVEEKVGSRMASSSLHSSNSVSTLESTEAGSVSILTYQSMSALLHLVKSTTSGSLGFEHFSPSVNISVELCISFFKINSPNSVPFSGRTCDRWIQTCNSSGTMLSGGSIACHSSQHDGRHSLSVFCHKIYCEG